MNSVMQKWFFFCLNVFQGHIQHSIWIKCKILDGNYHKIASRCSQWHACTNKGTLGCKNGIIYAMAVSFKFYKYVYCYDSHFLQAYSIEICRPEHHALGLSIVSKYIRTFNIFVCIGSSSSLYHCSS